jgi:hypothetical protein
MTRAAAYISEGGPGSGAAPQFLSSATRPPGSSRSGRFATCCSDHLRGRYGGSRVRAEAGPELARRAARRRAPPA